MRAAKLAKSEFENNPLDEFEDLLESSTYDYDRASQTRLHFDCDGKQGFYGIILEWNREAHIIKCSVVITATQSVPAETLSNCVARANESAWHGFFMIDGVGNSIFKSLLQYQNTNSTDVISLLEDTIDSAIREADRFSVSLALSNQNNLPSLFNQDDEWSLENLTLMFSETKGNA